MDTEDDPTLDAVSGVGSETEGIADHYADHLAALHRMSTLAGDDVDARLDEWLSAGAEALQAVGGLLFLGAAAHLRVRAGTGNVPVEVGAEVLDQRLVDVVDRRATVATLGGPGATAASTENPLGPGPLVATPLWAAGEVVGVVAFVAPAEQGPYSAWQLALVDVVADGVARVLERTGSVSGAGTSRDTADVVALMPDPVVRLDAAGRLLDDAGIPGRPFDPCAALRGDREPAPDGVLREMREGIRAALAAGDLHTTVITSGPSVDRHQMEVRIVPAGPDEVLCIVRDVTDRHRAEAALSEQLAFETLVASISSRLISSPATSLDEVIETGLGEIATFFTADCAFIYELAADGATLRVSHLWYRPGSNRARERGQAIDLAGFARVTARFERGGRAFVRGPGVPRGDNEELPMVVDGDRGVLWVRLGVGGDLAGVVGLAWLSHEPPADDDVLGLIRFAADSFHSALRRRALTVVAAGQAEVFELIARGAPADSAVLAARDLLARSCLGATVEVLVIDEGTLRLVSEHDEHPWVDWAADQALDLGNPFGQAVITGEPVLLADATRDPRFTPAAVPDTGFRSLSVMPVRSPRTGRALALVMLLGDRAGDLVVPAAVRDSVSSLIAVALERAADEELLAHQATHDPLTGVGNRAALLDRLSLVLARAARTSRTVAVLFCDLDSFKAVNDIYGHDRGDRVLVEVAERIKRAVRPSDTVSRTGGDEFVVVCDDLDGPEQAEQIAARVRSAISGRPIDIVEARLDVTASVGLAVADPLLHDPDRLLRMADLAMYEAKHGSRDPVEAEERIIALESSPLGVELASAIGSGSLELYQQPLVGRDGSLAGVEMLVRWPHREHGLLGADRILGAAVDADLTRELGRWVRRRALELRRSWSGSRVGATLPPVHVNVARSEFEADTFCEDVEADVIVSGADPADLILEIREADLAGGDQRVVLEDLRRRGFAVVVDAVGEGGLPFMDLADLPVAGLKIGPALLARLGSGDGGEAAALETVRSLVLLAHGLGWRSLAVGVESDQQRSVLFGFGIDAVQGRAVAMPAPAQAFGLWLDAPGSRP